MPALSLRNLSHHYGDRTALADVSFDVPAGCVFGLLGPNGSGKTTLFRLLSTTVPLQSGAATVAGFDLASQPHEVRKRLGVVFQSPALDLHLTALENLTHHGHLYGLRGTPLRSRALELLTALGLQGREHDRAKTFSGGMKRRVELAKALLHRPALLLLDEPSTGLDPAARLDLWTHLRHAASALGVTLLLSTHLMDEAERCDRLAVLSEGRLVADGTPDRLKRHVGGAVVRLSTRDPSRASAAVATIFSVTPTPAPDGTLRFEHPDPAPLLPALTTALGPDLKELTVGQPTLEDVFLHLTGRSLAE
jgi:ABC-2 type transport system ATP-binding protein